MLSEKSIAIVSKLSKRKYIPLSHGGQVRGVDISEFLPIVDHQYFQSMKYKRQLANAHIIFPDAHHTRFLHSIDAFCWQSERSDFWQTYGMISPDEARALNVYALIHDIGHGPYSHVLDRICSMNHDENGARRIHEMKEAIEKCGDFARISGLFQEKDEVDPLYKAVMHHPLGTDKFSYLSLDARHCIAGVPDFGRLPAYIFWLDNELAVQKKCLYDLIELKRFYIKMYREVYLRKSCLIGQRIIEKEIHHLLAADIIDEPELWEMTDEELTAKICRTKRGRRGYNRYQGITSKCAAAFKLGGFGWTENVSGKSMAIFEKSEAFFENMEKNSSPSQLDIKEKELARLLGTDPLDLDIVPPMARYRFSPKPVAIIDGETKIMDSEFSDNDKAIKELAGACTVLRVCATKPFRETVYKKAELINEFFDAWFAELQKK